MQRQGKELSELHDVLGLRIVFKPSAPARLPVSVHWQRQAMLCYRVLEVVHSQFPPEAATRFKDYITHPKPNGYQSLHSSVWLGDLNAEIQVRTTEMHRYA